MIKDLDSISIFREKHPILNKTDRISVWGEIGGAMFPLAYIHKPRGLSDDFWKEIKEKLVIELNK